MAERFTTPPRKTCPATPPPPAKPGEVIVSFDGAVSGNYIAAKKVTATTTLFDIRTELVAAMGGRYSQNEIHLLDPGGVLHDKAFGQPFSRARDGDRYAAILTTLEDMVYLDMSDRKRGGRPRMRSAAVEFETNPTHSR